jgi:hypothetical protein
MSERIYSRALKDWESGTVFYDKRIRQIMGKHYQKELVLEVKERVE